MPQGWLLLPRERAHDDAKGKMFNEPFKGKMFSAAEADKSQMKNLVSPSASEFKTSHAEHFRGCMKSKAEMEMDAEHMIRMDDASFSRFAQEALLRNVDINAKSHDACYTDRLERQ